MSHKREDEDHRYAKKQKPSTGGRRDPWTDDVDDDDHQFCRNKVRESLKQFNETLTKLLKERKVSGKRTPQRTDTIAANILKKEGEKWVNSNDQVGRVSGIEIGDQFQFRAEMVVVGLHKPQMHGIGYIRLFNKIYVTSIVNSSRYNNVRVSDNEFEYMGEGGNPSISRKKAMDQNLTNGNLALRTNMQEKLPVRVIHYWESDGGTSSSLKSDGGKY